jgi:hypothetical protein
VLFSDWQHVGILIETFRDNESAQRPQYLHLFENQFGDRRHELVRPTAVYWVPDGKGSNKRVEQIPINLIEEWPVFQTKVYPWLNGATVADIPAYNRVEKHRFVRNLQGKNPMVLNEEEKK